MKLPACLSLTYIGLLLLTLDNGAYNIPIFADYSLYYSDSVENVGMISDCTERVDCLKVDIIDENEVGDIISDPGTKNNCISNTSNDINTVSNEVQVLSQSTDKNQINNNTFYKTSTTTDKNYELHKLVDCVMNDFVPSDDSDDSDNLTFAKRDDNVGNTIVDDILYKDMPAFLIISIVNDDGEDYNIKVENAVQVTGDEIMLNYNKAIEALADFINKEDMSLEDSKEWNEDSEPEEPQRIVENGYIFYDMGSQE